MSKFTVTEVEYYGETRYRISLERGALHLSNNSDLTADELDKCVAIAEALPEGYSVSFSPARRGQMLAHNTWIIWDGDRKIASVDAIDKIVPAAQAYKNRTPKAPAPVEAPAPALKPGWSNASKWRRGASFAPSARDAVRVIFHGDDHYTYTYADGRQYDTEIGWL